MKVLFVSSGNSVQGISPFVREQGESLKKLGIHLDFFLISGKGIRGYFKHIFFLRRYLRNHHYNILHGHFIWSILACLFQPKIIHVGTFPGSDLNLSKLRFIARNFIIPRLALSIVVSNKMAKLVAGQKVEVIPYGIDFDKFYPIEKSDHVSSPRIQAGKINILFCSTFQRPVKNAALAFEAVSILAGKYEINLIELKDFERSEINLVLNLCDLMLLTSFTEGSPQIIKEAMACNCPIVATDVGDIRERMEGVAGCYLTTFESSNVASNIEKAIQFNNRTDGRNHIQQFSNQIVAERIKSEYERLLTLSK